MFYAGFRKRCIAIMFDAIILIPFLLGFQALGLDGRFFEAFVCCVYFAGLESSPMQGTLGKFLIGIKVTDLYGNRINLRVAIVRLIGKQISFLLFFIGYFMVPFNPKKQGLHDIISGCLVVTKHYTTTTHINHPSRSHG
jgi:uncharacterized RDD family membrane protein YckC